jgi:hypothetical protein
VTADSETPDPKHSVPRVSFGSADEVAEPDETQQDETARELQQENAETSLDQPST